VILAVSEMPSTPSSTASPSMTKEEVLFFNADSTIQGVAIGPVVAVPGEQLQPLALALNDQVIAVLPDLMEPIRSGGDLGTARRDARLERNFGHAVKIGSAAEISSLGT